MEAVAENVVAPAIKSPSAGKRKRAEAADGSVAEKKPRAIKKAETSGWLTVGELQQIVATAGSFEVLDSDKARKKMREVDQASECLPKVLAFEDDGSLSVYKNGNFFLPVKASTTLTLAMGLRAPLMVNFLASGATTEKELEETSKLVDALKAIVPAAAQEPAKKAPKKTFSVTASVTQDLLSMANKDLFILRPWMALDTSLANKSMTMVEADGRLFIVWVNIRQVKVPILGSTSVEPELTIPLVFELKSNARESRQSVQQLLDEFGFVVSK